MAIKLINEDELIKYLEPIAELGKEFYREFGALKLNFIDTNNPLDYRAFSFTYKYTVESLVKQIEDITDQIPKPLSLSNVKKYSRLEKLYNEILSKHKVLIRVTELKYLPGDIKRGYFQSSGDYTYLDGVDKKSITFWSMLPFVPYNFSIDEDYPIIIISKDVPNCYPTFYTPFSRPVDQGLGDTMIRLNNGKILSLQYNSYMLETEKICENMNVKNMIGLVKPEVLRNAMIKMGLINEDEDYFLEGDYDEVFNKIMKKISSK